MHASAFALTPYRTDSISTTLVSRIFLNLRDPELLSGGRRLVRWTLTVGDTPIEGNSNTVDDHIGSVTVCVQVVSDSDVGQERSSIV